MKKKFKKYSYVLSMKSGDNTYTSTYTNITKDDVDKIIDSDIEREWYHDYKIYKCIPYNYERINKINKERRERLIGIRGFEFSSDEKLSKKEIEINKERIKRNENYKGGTFSKVSKSTPLE